MSRLQVAFLIAVVAGLGGIAVSALAFELGVALIVAAGATFAALAFVTSVRAWRNRPLAPWASLARSRRATGGTVDATAGMSPKDISGAFVIAVLLLVVGLAATITAPSAGSSSLMALGVTAFVATGAAMLWMAWRTRG